MKEESRNKIPPMDLQLFAESDVEGPDGASGTQDITNEEAGVGKEESTPKTYTQEEVNAMLAKEKRQGKNSVLKKLGLKDVNEGVEKLGIKDEKSVDEKKSDSGNLADKAQIRLAEQRAIMAERKLAVLALGATKESVEDIVLIASSKVTDDEDFESVVEEMSSNKKYAMFFGKDEKNGTGSSAGGYKRSENAAAGAFGKKLAENMRKNSSIVAEGKNFFDN